MGEADDDEDDWAARVPVAISMAAGASTAVIACQDEGALERSSTSAAALCGPPAACCCLSLALGLCCSGFAVLLALLVGAVVGAVVVVVVVVVGLAWPLGAGIEGLEDEDFDLLLALVACCWLVLGVVSFELLWPKLAASLLLISETAPFSAVGDLMVTSLTRARLLAVGVDLITRRKTRCCCCSPETTQSAKARATVKHRMSLMMIRSSFKSKLPSFYCLLLLSGCCSSLADLLITTNW